MNTFKTQILVSRKLIARSLGASMVLAALMLANGRAHAASAYFDTNGATAGSGVVNSGTYGWTVGTNWSGASAGTTATSAWVGGDDAIFTAGADATGKAFTSTLSSGITTVNSLTLNSSGTLTISGITGSSLSVTSGTVSVATGGVINIGAVAPLGGSSGLTKEGGGLLSILGASGNIPTYTGDTTVNDGTMKVAARYSASSRLVVNNSGIFQAWGGGVTVAGISSTSATAVIENSFINPGASTLTLNAASGTQTFAGIIRNGAANLLAINKAGAYTQRFSGNNIYTGTTTVTVGTLLINGNNSSATGAVSVSAAGTLGGTGTIGGATTVAAGGKLSAGDSSRATLTFSNGLDLSAVNSTSSLLFSLDTVGNSDRIASGALTIGSGVLGFNDFAFTADAGFGNGTYTLFSSTGITGTLDGANLTGLVGGLNSTLSLSGNDVLLTVVPEPSTAGLLLLGLALSAVAKRKRG